MNYLKQNCRAPLIAWLKGFPFTVTFNKPGRGSDTFLGLPSIAFFLDPIQKLPTYWGRKENFKIYSPTSCVSLYLHSSQLFVGPGDDESSVTFISDAAGNPVEFTYPTNTRISFTVKVGDCI